MSKRPTLDKLYTTRWNISKAIDMLEEPQAKEAAIVNHLDDARRDLDLAIIFAKEVEIEDPKDQIEEPDRPNLGDPGQKLLSCPFANKSTSHITRGRFRKGYPEGVIVHWTSGHCDTELDAFNSVKGGKSDGYAFWAIGPTGVVYQTHQLDRWGYHAGKSTWPRLGSSVSQYLLGIEMVCAGKVDASGKSWFGKKYSADRLRQGPKEDNCAAGYYVKYTQAQEEALENLILWLKRNNPDVFSLDLVLGHDSVSPGRKTDPGWSLSMTIPEYQLHLKKEYAKL